MTLLKSKTLASLPYIFETAESIFFNVAHHHQTNLSLLKEIHIRKSEDSCEVARRKIKFRNHHPDSII